ncbi:MAG TPA: VOC family protein [Blastocatellia bacterium]|nr:VOC family protein [Blastocatellia bacterium]
MQLSPYLGFNGQCEVAFKLYQECLGGTMQFKMTWGESPMADQVSAEWRDKIMHASLIIGETVLLGADSPPEHYEAPRGISVTIPAKTVADAERFFEKLSEGGTVTMPLQKTFWSPGFAMFVDRFGIPWMISTEQAPA